MSGWVHKCLNGNRIIIRHGDFSGYVEFVDQQTNARILIPGCDVLTVVAEHVRARRYSVLEKQISSMDESEVLGIDRIPGPPSDLNERPEDE